MKREIKFRAWDKVTNKIVTVWWISWKAWDGQDGGINYVTIELDGTVERDEDNVVLLQGTGLKDKNGKEIYEGDFIDTGVHKVKGYTEFHAGCFSLKITHTKSKHIDIGQSIPLFEFDVLEIKGNIYEHPQLLK